MWPQFICPNCRAVADLEADVDDPFPEAEWEEIDPADMMEDQQADPPAQGALLPSALSVPNINSGTGAVSNSGNPPDNAGDTLIGNEPGVQQSRTQVNFSHPHLQPTPFLQESNSSVGPVNIRQGRSSSRQESTSATADNNPDEPFIPNGTQITPSKTPQEVRDTLAGPDGPMTPRNDAGPFVFDGSAGQASGAQISTLNLTASPSSRPSGS
jgi:E3 ubiquitin-protein ligase DMA1/2